MVTYEETVVRVTRPWNHVQRILTLACISTTTRGVCGTLILLGNLIKCILFQFPYWAKIYKINMQFIELSP